MSTEPGEVHASIDAGRRAAQLALADGESVEVDAGYLEAGHLGHGYALTAHKAQGATVDRAFVLGSEDLYREWGYTALSRHRDEARFYLVSPGSAERTLSRLTDQRDPLVERLEDLFDTSRAKTLATDQLDAAERRAELEQLAADHQRLLADEQWADRQRRGAERGRDAARHQLERLRDERANVGLFDRSERQRIKAMTAAAEFHRDHSDQAAADHAEALAEATNQRNNWLEDNANRATLLLASERDALTEQHVALRDEIAHQLGRDDTLLERDAHAHEITREAHPELAPELPAVDVDVGLDFGP